jgi:MFS family permease
MLRNRFGGSLAAMRGVYANPNLRRVQLAAAGASIGQFAYGVAIAVYAYEHGGAIAVGVVAAVRQIVAALIAPFSASLADRFPREKVMLSSGLSRVATVALTTVLVIEHAPAVVVYVVATVTTVLGTVFRPAESSLIPRLASTPEELTAANVSASTFDSLGVFVGPSIAAFLLALGGPAAAFGFIVATYIWSSLFIARVHPPPEAQTTERRTTEHGVGSISAGFRAIGHEPRLRLLFALYGAQCLVAGALGVFVVAIALKLLGLGTAGVGLLQAACGVGALLGAAVSLSLVSRARIATDFAIGLLLWGAPLLLIGAVPTAVIAAVALGIVGVGNTIVDISAMTLLQRAAPPDVAGRVFGCLESVIVGSLALGALIAPLLITTIGIRGALFAMGSLLPVLSILRWRSLGQIDHGAVVPEERLAALRVVPFLAALPLQTLEYLGERLADVSLVPGQVLFEAGDHGDRFYLLHDGKIEIDLPGQVKVEEAPTYVGEIALLRDIPRTATVRAQTAASLWALERDDFLDAVTGHARSLASADEVMVTRLGVVTA